MSTLDQFNESLEELLTEHDLSYLKFSKEIGINVNMIYRWKNKIYLPTISQIIKIADFFDCSVHYILGLTDSRDYSKSNESSTFLERYDLLIQRNGYNDHQVSIMCEIGRGAISKWRKLGQLPSTSTLVKLAEVLSCSVDYLICRSDSY